MVAWIEPQITQTTIVTSEGAVVALSQVVGLNCYRKSSPILSTVSFLVGFGFVASFATAFFMHPNFVIFVAGWSLIGVLIVGACSPLLKPIWRVEILTPSGPVVAYESIQERPARMVTAKIHSAIFV